MPFPDFTPTVPVLIHRAAEKFGERPLFVHGERRISYTEPEAESARLARGLLSSGVGKGTRLALLMPNGPDWILAWLAASRIGALVVPLNTFYRPREIGWALHHSDAHTLLTYSRFLNNDYLGMLEQAVPGLAEQQAGSIRVISHP